MEQQLRELLETAQPFIESDEEKIALEIIDKFPKRGGKRKYLFSCRILLW